MIRYATLVDGRPGVVRICGQTSGEPDMFLTLREAGDMVSQDARRRVVGELAGGAGADSEAGALHAVRQVHSARVVWATGSTLSAGPPAGGSTPMPNVEADGMLTDRRGDVLGVTVADCMPIYLFAAGGRDAAENGHAPVFGILHSGWKGTGIAAEALRMLETERGIAAHSVTAVLGPSIRSCCYRVDRERGEYFASSWGEEAVRRDGEAWYLDLVAANTGLLRSAGVEDIRVVDSCTMCEERFGSYRREGSEGFTHMLAMIGYFK